LKTFLITHPLACVFSTWSGWIWQDSSTTSFKFPLLSLAVMVLMEDVKTTLFTELDFKQDLRRFMVPLIAGPIMFSCTKDSASSIQNFSQLPFQKFKSEKFLFYVRSIKSTKHSWHYHCFLSHYHWIPLRLQHGTHQHTLLQPHRSFLLHSNPLGRISIGHHPSTETEDAITLLLHIHKKVKN